MVSNSALFLELLLLVSFNIPFSYSSVLDFVHPLSFVLISPYPLYPFHLGPKISGRDLLLVEESCNAPDSLRQVSSSYSSLLPCHLLACCILPCHHVCCISMFSKLASVRVSSSFPLSVLSPDTLARARGASEYLFCEWPKNVLGMG